MDKTQEKNLIVNDVELGNVFLDSPENKKKIERLNKLKNETGKSPVKNVLQTIRSLFNF